MYATLKSTIEQLRQGNTSIPVATLELRGGITNKNIRVQIGEATYVISIDTGSAAALGIDREIEYHNTCQAFQYGIGPEVILRTPKSMVTRFVEGKILEAGDLTAYGNMSVVVDALRRCHQIPLEQVAGTYNVFHAVKRHLRKLHYLQQNFTIHLNHIMEKLESIQNAFKEQGYVPVFCHNDTVPGNMILTENGLVLLDWEYSGVGDRFFDLGMLATYHDLDDVQEEQLIEAYFGVAYPGALARLRLMRAMSDLRDATWGIVQSRYSSLEFDFISYSMKRFQRFYKISTGPRFKKSLALAASKARLSSLRKE